MDARLTEEQRLLADMATEVAADLGTNRSADLDTPADVAASWQVLVDTGLVGMRAPASVGGTEAGGVEVAIIAEAFGRHLVRVPLVPALCAIELLGATDAAASIVDGSRLVTLGVSDDLRSFEAGARTRVFDATGVSTAVACTPDGVIEVDLAGARPCDTVDLTRTVVEVDVPDSDPRALDLDRRLRAEALATTALAAEMVGIMDATVTIAVDHARERVQFDRPIGSFQAVQQLAAAQLVTIEGARGLALHAGWALDELDPPEALMSARCAKAYASESVRTVCEAAIQILGGIGMTWEHLAHAFLRRGLLDRAVLGDEYVQWAAIATTRMKATAPTAP